MPRVQSDFEGMRIIATGELAGSATAAQMPDISCNFVCFIAVQSNSGQVYLGLSGVTKVDGTTDTTTGYELVAKQSTGWLPCNNMKEFYRICDNAGDDLTYICVG